MLLLARPGIVPLSQTVASARCRPAIAQRPSMSVRQGIDHRSPGKGLRDDASRRSHPKWRRERRGVRHGTHRRNIAPWSSATGWRYPIRGSARSVLPLQAIGAIGRLVRSVAVKRETPGTSHRLLSSNDPRNAWQMVRAYTSHLDRGIYDSVQSG
jgi:hypothetical protein